MVSDLYHRVLLWHKLICMQTGGLALCSVKHRLNRDEALKWVAAFRNVADDIEAVLAGQPFILDDKGQRIVKSAGEETTSRAAQEVRHVEPAHIENSVEQKAPSPKAGGRRVATRKKQ